MQVQTSTQHAFTNRILRGDCIEVMRQMPANSVDFILTDPPYLVNYCDRIRIGGDSPSSESAKSRVDFVLL
jgi:DNA modification methylase